MKRNDYYINFILLSLLLFSCKKFIEIPAPKNQLVNSEVFADSANASSAVLGIYINMLPNFTAQLTNGGLTIYGGLLSDELYPTANNIDENEFYTNNISVVNGVNSSLWRIAYSIIYNCNACIEGLQKSITLSPSLKKQLLSESKFVRAFLYFNLVNLYGDVPLVISTDYNNNKLLNRTSEDSIYSLIVTDLKEAQSHLQENYVTTGRFRPNLYTIDALLSKVYLFRKNWVASESLSTAIINSGKYSLEADPDNIYRANSNEAIWKLASIFPSIETWEGNFFIPTSSTRIPKYVISDFLLNAFEPGDQRKAKWLRFNTVNGQNYYYPFKYKIRSAGSTPQENFTVFRLAEQYLIRAEARAQQNNALGATMDLNVIRTRAGLPDLSSGLSQDQLLDAVLQERRIELFCEWGNRWLDLKRTNKLDQLLAPIKGNNWQSMDALLPVPQSELNTNPFLTQNPGYN